jgi:hypothetical protein
MVLFANKTTPLANGVPLANGHAHWRMLSKALFRSPMHLIHQLLRKYKDFAYKKHLICELCRLLVNRTQK